MFNTCYSVMCVLSLSGYQRVRENVGHYSKFCYVIWTLMPLVKANYSLITRLSEHISKTQLEFALFGVFYTFLYKKYYYVWLYFRKCVQMETRPRRLRLNFQFCNILHFRALGRISKISEPWFPEL